MRSSKRTAVRVLWAVTLEERSMSTAAGCPTSVATQLQTVEGMSQMWDGFNRA